MNVVFPVTVQVLSFLAAAVYFAKGIWGHGFYWLLAGLIGVTVTFLMKA